MYFISILYRMRYSEHKESFWQTGFHFPARSARAFRGRLFLARVPQTFQPARQQSPLLAAQTFHQQKTRPPCHSHPAQNRMDRPSDLGTRTHSKKRNPTAPPNQACLALTLPPTPHSQLSTLHSFHPHSQLSTIFRRRLHRAIRVVRGQ